MGENDPDIVCGSSRGGEEGSSRETAPLPPLPLPLSDIDGEEEFLIPINSCLDEDSLGAAKSVDDREVDGILTWLTAAADSMDSLALSFSALDCISDVIRVARRAAA